MAAPPAGNVSRVHVPELDGIRGLAIALVITYHAFPWIPTHVFLEKFLYFTASAGWVGVDLFFVLSGFLITGILLDTRGTAGQLRRFYVRRILRIVPAYLLLIGVLALLVVVGLVGYPGLGPAFLAAALYVSNLYFAFLPPSVPVWAPLGVTWSLAVEEQFYLVWPALARASEPRRLARFCLIGIVIVVLARLLLVLLGVRAPNVFHYLTPFKFDALCTGALLACLVRAPRFDLADFRRRLHPVAASSAAAALALFVSNSLNRESPVLYGVGFAVLSAASGSLIALAFAHQGSRATAALRLGALRHLGRISYGLYLYHQIPNWFFEDHLRDGPWLRSLGLVENIGESSFRFVFVWCGSLAAATLSWHLVERPLLALKDSMTVTPAESPLSSR